MTLNFFHRFVPFQAVALLLAAMVAGPAWADVRVRVEGRPISSPIQAYVRVTNNSVAVPGLNQTNFGLILDGVPLPQLQAGDFKLPPDQSNQKVSVVFAMDYSSSVTDIYRDEMEAAVIAFIDAMKDGDYAAIVKFNDTNPARASVVHPFTEIGADNSALETAVTLDYPGVGSPILDAIRVAVDQFDAPPVPLPAGPNAIIIITDGADNSSGITQGEAIADANGVSVAIFAIGVGDFADPDNTTLLTNLATETGGEFVPAPDEDAIAGAYASVSELLRGEYLLTIPLSISDPITGNGCDVHALEVTVAPYGSESADFTRRVCNTAPDNFSFTSQAGLNPNTGVRSNTVTISGLEVPADVSIIQGTYSIGCGDDSTFTGDSGTISDDQMICVRHTTSTQYSTAKVTTLTIGGVARTFTSTTRAAPNSGGGGGGGATGGVELLLGLAALFARRRRLA